MRRQATMSSSMRKMHRFRVIPPWLKTVETMRKQRTIWFWSDEQLSLTSNWPLHWIIQSENPCKCTCRGNIFWNEILNRLFWSILFSNINSYTFSLFLFYLLPNCFAENGSLSMQSIKTTFGPGLVTNCYEWGFGSHFIRWQNTIQRFII